MTQIAEVALGGEITHEPGLPHPWVAYPRRHGTFHTFADTPEGPWQLCRCTQPAAANLANIFAIDSLPADAARSFARTSGFPDQTPVPDPWNHLHNSTVWADAACHRCNKATPMLRWTHETSAGQFKQSHGWYIEQARTRAGFIREDLGAGLGRLYADDAPVELVELRAQAIPRVQAPEGQWFLKLREMINKQAGTQDQHTITAATNSLWNKLFDPREQLRPEHLAVVPAEDRETVEEWKRVLTPDPAARRRWNRLFEDEVRIEFGYRKIGEGFVAETQLASIVAEIVGPDVTIIRHHRPDWLERLELDIWLPDLKIGIEYQGQQHYKPVEAWGGADALARQQERDTRKRRLCAESGVTLVEISYAEPLTRSHVQARIQSAHDGGSLPAAA